MGWVITQPGTSGWSGRCTVQKYKFAWVNVPAGANWVLHLYNCIYFCSSAVKQLCIGTFATFERCEAVHVYIIYLLECYDDQMCKCVYHEVLQLYTLAQLYRFVQLSSASALQLLNGAIERMRRPDRRLAGTSIIGASRCICKIKNNSKTYHV